MKLKKDPILQTDNYVTIFNTCKDALVNQKMIAIIGAPGYGKTTALGSFKKEFQENTVIIKAQKSMSPKIFFSTILNIYGDEKYTSTMNLNRCIYNAAELFNSEQYNKLLIIDEAGKFSPPMLEYMHEFRDLTLFSTGIVLAGVDYFKSNLEHWTEQNRVGIPEVYSRINSWQCLKAPTIREIAAIVKSYGIEDEGFVRAHRHVNDYRILVNRIKDYLMLLDLEKQLEKENSKKNKSESKSKLEITSVTA